MSTVDEPAADAPAAEAAPATPRRATRSRASAPDAVLARAVDVARAAAEEVAEDGTVGEHLGVAAEGERCVSHQFACLSPAYRGWRWSVTIARAPRRAATIDEVHLVPGPDAVLAPPWLPWEDRIRPGDLSPGDLLPKRVDDPLLVEGYEATGEEDEDRVALWELGLGRPRVLSPEGRSEAAQRWYDGAHGPRAPHAEQAPAPCSSCGYFLQMAGALRTVFGVCANEWSPSDGQVVSLDHGCGAHSEVDIDRSESRPDPPRLDELGYEEVVIERPAPVEAAAGEASPDADGGTAEPAAGEGDPGR